MSEVNHHLAKDYIQIPHYNTKQRILIPINSDSEGEEQDKRNSIESPITLSSPMKQKVEKKDDKENPDQAEPHTDK